MKVTYDPAAQSGYLQITQKPVAKTVEVSESVLCDVDKEGKLCGFELLHISSKEFKSVSKGVTESQFVS